MTTRRPPGIPFGAVAVCDLGTFSGLILIARRRGGALQALLEEAHTIDLYRESRSSRHIGRSAIKRATEVLERLDLLADRYSCSGGMVVTTEAIRAADNRKQVVAELQSGTRYPIRVVSQRREAELTANGALSGLPRSHKPACVVDIGGGSTELIFQSGGNWRFHGVRIGAARATAQWSGHLRSSEKTLLPLAENAVRRLRLPPAASGLRLVGVGGTITTLAAMARRHRHFDPARIHGMTLSREWLLRAGERFTGLSESEIARLIPFDQKRARVLTAGTFLWAAVLNRVGAQEVTVSVRGLRWGAAARLTEGTRV